MSDHTASYKTVKLMLTSQEYIRWLGVANKKRTTAAGLARWLALEYMENVRQRELSQATTAAPEDKKP